MMTPEQAVVASILLCVAGAVLTIPWPPPDARGWLAFAVTAGAAILILGAVAHVLTVGPSPQPAKFWSCRAWDSPSACMWTA